MAVKFPHDPRWVAPRAIPKVDDVTGGDMDEIWMDQNYEEMQPANKARNHR